MRPGADDRPDMLASQRGGESTRLEAIDWLHMRQVARGGHGVEKRAVDGQRGLLLGEMSGARLADQLRALAAGVMKVI